MKAIDWVSFPGIEYSFGAILQNISFSLKLWVSYIASLSLFWISMMLLSFTKLSPQMLCTNSVTQILIYRYLLVNLLQTISKLVEHNQNSLNVILQKEARYWNSNQSHFYQEANEYPFVIMTIDSFMKWSYDIVLCGNSYDAFEI